MPMDVDRLPQRALYSKLPNAPRPIGRLKAALQGRLET